MIDWFLYGLVFALCAVVGRICYLRGIVRGEKDGWIARERYGNGGRRQWQNKKPVKGIYRRMYRDIDRP